MKSLSFKPGDRVRTTEKFHDALRRGMEAEIVRSDPLFGIWDYYISFDGTDRAFADEHELELVTPFVGSFNVDGVNLDVFDIKIEIDETKVSPFEEWAEENIVGEKDTPIDNITCDTVHPLIIQFIREAGDQLAEILSSGDSDDLKQQRKEKLEGLDALQRQIGICLAMEMAQTFFLPEYPQLAPDVDRVQELLYYPVVLGIILEKRLRKHFYPEEGE